MRTAYDALRKAVIKDFGKWYKRKWSDVSDEEKDRVRGGAAYNHFGNPFLDSLHHLYMGDEVIRGEVGWGCDFEDEFNAMISQLKVPFQYHWYVYSTYSFDFWFELRGFKSKAEAIDCYKRIKKHRAGSIFHVFWFRW